MGVLLFAVVVGLGAYLLFQGTPGTLGRWLAVAFALLLTGVAYYLFASRASRWFPTAD